MQLFFVSTPSLLLLILYLNRTLVKFHCVKFFYENAAEELNDFRNSSEYDQIQWISSPYNVNRPTVRICVCVCVCVCKSHVSSVLLCFCYFMAWWLLLTRSKSNMLASSRIARMQKLKHLFLFISWTPWRRINQVGILAVAGHSPTCDFHEVQGSVQLRAMLCLWSDLGNQALISSLWDEDGKPPSDLWASGCLRERSPGSCKSVIGSRIFPDRFGKIKWFLPPH